MWWGGDEYHVDSVDDDDVHKVDNVDNDKVDNVDNVDDVSNTWQKIVYPSKSTRTDISGLAN